MALGLGLACVAMLGLLRLEPGTQVWAIWWDFLVLGLGAGLALPPMTATGARLDLEGGEAFVRGLHHATLVSAALLAVALVLALVLAPRAGSGAP